MGASRSATFNRFKASSKATVMAAVSSGPNAVLISRRVIGISLTYGYEPGKLTFLTYRCCHEQEMNAVEVCQGTIDAALCSRQFALQGIKTTLIGTHFGDSAKKSLSFLERRSSHLEAPLWRGFFCRLMIAWSRGSKIIRISNLPGALPRGPWLIDLN